MEQVAKVEQVTARLSTTLTAKKEKKNAPQVASSSQMLQILTVYELHRHYNIKTIQCLTMYQLNGRNN